MDQETMVSVNDNFQNWIRRIAAIAAVISTVAIGGPVFAQDGGSGSQSGETSSGQSEASADSSGSDGGGEQAGQKEQGPDPDDPDYWSEVRKIHTVQKRSFQKVGRLGVSAYGGLIPNNIFERYYPVGLRLDYFILENIGLELSGSHAFRSKTSLEGVMNESQGINAETVRVADTQMWHTNFGLVWSPFYGKTSFYENAINYFDMYLFGGAGIVVTKTPQFANQDLSEVDATIKEEGVIGAGISFYMFNHGILRADFRQFIFRKVKGVGGVANPSEVSVGFGYFF